MGNWIIIHKTSTAKPGAATPGRGTHGTCGTCGTCGAVTATASAVSATSSAAGWGNLELDLGEGQLNT